MFVFAADDGAVLVNVERAEREESWRRERGRFRIANFGLRIGTLVFGLWSLIFGFCTWIFGRRAFLFALCTLLMRINRLASDL